MNKNLQQWENDSRSVASYYTDKITEKGYTVEVLANRDEKYVNLFFDELFTGISFGGASSFLDIGSGLGLLLPYLEARDITITEYLGIDLIPDFIDYSKKTYPAMNFQVDNFISTDFTLPIKYEYVIALGVLVSRVSNYEEFLKEFIMKMVSYSSKYVLFNLITKVDAESPNYSNKDRIGGITPIPKKRLEEILDSITGITYEIIEKKIFDDATDAFIRITVK